MNGEDYNMTLRLGLKRDLNVLASISIAFAPGLLQVSRGGRPMEPMVILAKQGNDMTDSPVCSDRVASEWLMRVYAPLSNTHWGCATLNSTCFITSAVWTATPWAKSFCPRFKAPTNPTLDIVLFTFAT